MLCRIVCISLIIVDSSPSLIRPLPPKATHRTRPDFRCTESIVKYYLSPQERPSLLQGHFFIAELVAIYERGYCTRFSTKNVSLNPAHGETSSIQQYVINVFSDLRQADGFLWALRFPPPINLTSMR